MGSIFHFPDYQTFGWTLLVLVFLFHCSIAQQLSPPTRHSWQSQSFQPPLSQQREHQHKHQHAYDDLQDYERIVHRSSNEPTRHASSYLEDPRSAAIIAFVLAALILYVEPTIGRFYKSWRQQQRLRRVKPRPAAGSSFRERRISPRSRMRFWRSVKSGLQKSDALI